MLVTTVTAKSDSNTLKDNKIGYKAFLHKTFTHIAKTSKPVSELFSSVWHCDFWFWTLFTVGSRPRIPPSIVATKFTSCGKQTAGKHIEKSKVIPSSWFKVPLKVWSDYYKIAAE